MTRAPNRPAGAAVARYVVSACVLAAAAPAQFEAFEQAHGEYLAAREARAPRGEQTAAAARALDAFLAVPTDAAGRGARLAPAAEVALAADDAQRALAYAREAEARGEDLGVLLLTALQRVEGPAAALDAAYARRERTSTADYLVAARAIDRGELFLTALARFRDGDRAVPMWTLERTAGRLEEWAVANPDAAGLAAEAGIARGNAALLHRLLGDHDTALAGYDRAVELAPDDDILWSDRGLAYKAAGKLDEAVASFRRSVAVESAAGQGPATTNLAVLATAPVGRERPEIRDTLAAVARRGGIETGEDRGPDAPEPLDAAMRVLLRLRPDQAIVRRLWIERILQR